MAACLAARLDPGVICPTVESAAAAAADAAEILLDPACNATAAPCPGIAAEAVPARDAGTCGGGEGDGGAAGASGRCVAAGGAGKG